MTKTNKTTDFDDDLVRKLADLLEETGLTEIEYGKDDWHIRVCRGGQPVSYAMPTPQAAPGAAGGIAAAPTSGADDFGAHPGAVKSPMVGVVYMGPEPGAPNFIKVGDQVTEGQTMLLIEAMKVFNPIHAHKSGKVSRILVADGSPVEYGEPLVIIE